MRRSVAREHTPSILVATLSTAFGTALLQVTAALDAMIGADEVTGNSATVSLLLTLVAGVFIAIAVYVGAVVTTNTFATIIAGRTRTIALMRLIGASAASQRRAVAREGLLVGLAGAAMGIVAGTALAWLMITSLQLAGIVPAVSFPYFSPVIPLPAIAVVLCTWLASWVGSHRVLAGSPIEATGAATPRSGTQLRLRPGRSVGAVVTFAIGIGILLVGVAVGLFHPAGVLVGVLGGMVSFSGLVAGAHLVVPPVLRVVGRALGSGPAARLAAENAVRYPERSARNLVGLVIGITLVTTFAVALGSYQSILLEAAEADPGYYAGVETMFTMTIVVFSVLTGFSAIIAAVGMVTNLSLSVLQRTRELGLLRALGFTAGQVRRMVVLESVQLTATAVLLGLGFGIFYGWAGAQSLLGSIRGGPGLLLPFVPAVLVLAVVGAAALLALLASVVPARRATAVPPVAALADR